MAPFWDRTDGRAALILSLAAIGLGLVGALAADALYHLIMFFTNLAWYGEAIDVVRQPPRHLAPWMIGIPAIGGLIVGLMAHFGTDRIRGHGIPEAMEAIITKKSKVSARVAILKPISAAVAVGTGGPFGAEGPIIQTGGALGSLIGQALHLTADERKVFLACGAAAGMVGIFNTPIAAVALAVELLLFEFRARSLVPVVVASAVAAGTRFYLLGPNPMFAMPPFAESGPLALPLYVPLGILVGIAAVAISKGLFLVEGFVEDVLRLPVAIAPAVGGLLLGIIAFFEPRVLGMGYDTIAAAIAGQLSAADALQLALAKTAALWVALGSGTSGGLLAPMLLTGSALGSAYGQVVAQMLPGMPINPNVCAIVAMSALFAAAARTPFTSFLFAFELTGDYRALLPLMIGCMAADVVARLLTEHSVMTERLARRGLRIPHAYEADILTYLRVDALMRSDFETVPALAPVRDLLASLEPGYGWQAELESGSRRHRWWVVQAPDGRAVGIVTRRQLLNARSEPSLVDGPVSRLAQAELITAYPDETMHTALIRMLQHDVPWLPVVDRADPRRIIGYVSREDALAARRRRLEDEVIREGLIRTGAFRRGAQAIRQLESAPLETTKR